MDDQADPDSLEVLEELDLVAPRLAFSGPAARQPFVCEFVRELVETDLRALNTPNRASAPKGIAKLRAAHHSLARCLATGMQYAQAALVTGYSYQRIAMLNADPAFQQLVADYREEAKSWCADFGARMSDLGLDFCQLLQERLEDEPEKFSTSTILDAIKIFADRTGHGPGVELKVATVDSTIDRPPREDYDAWTKRRQRELAERTASLEPPTRTTN